MDLADVAEQPQATLKGHRAIEHPPERIAFKQVHFHYPGSTQPVFDGIDLLLERGRSTAIVGPNGAGKTTLVKLLARLYDPQAGAILIDGVPLSEFSPDSWRREIAVIFQDFVRYETTLAENIGVGSIDRLEDREVIAVAARKAGLGKPAGPRLYRGPGSIWRRVATCRACESLCGRGGRGDRPGARRTNRQS
jgi:ATP-binding cassette, subfamily B, bacterial